MVFWELSTDHSNQVSWVRFLVTAGFSLFSLVTSCFFYYGLARHKACLLLALSISQPVWWRHCQSTAARSTVLHCLKWYANDYGGRKHAHTHTHTHTRTRMHTHAHTCTHMHTHAHTRTHTHAHTRTHTHTHAHTCTHMHTHAHARTHTHAHTLMHMHTCAHMCLCICLPHY